MLAGKNAATPSRTLAENLGVIAPVTVIPELVSPELWCGIAELVVSPEFLKLTRRTVECYWQNASVLRIFAENTLCESEVRIIRKYS